MCHVNLCRFMDMVYAVWTNIFAILLHDYLDLFIVNLQLGIYMSSNQKGLDTDTSIGLSWTVYNAQAYGVIAGLAVTYTRLSAQSHFCRRLSQETVFLRESKV